jgi:membrane-bound lytic murein transglycosylase D
MTLRLINRYRVRLCLCPFLAALIALSITHQSLAQTIDNTDNLELQVDNTIHSDLTADPIEAFINEQNNQALESESQDDIWVRIRDGFEIPNIESAYTEKHENWYASRPDYVKRMLERSQKYLFHIVEEVEKRGMPTEIALLPMVESAYNPQAYSHSHASGIWQFVPATGKDFGLKQNWWADNRRDVTAATKAALTYLQKLHGMFGSWDLALAAYNAGEGTVSRAIERNRRLGLPTDYQHLALSEETKNYVPKLQAIKNIVFDPERYGLTLTAIPNRPYFTRVLAPKQIDAKLAAQLAEVSYEEFAALNPSYNRPVIVSNNEVHQLLLPVWAAEKFRDNLANYDKPLTTWKTYAAKRGERIDYIAKKFNIGVGQLRQVNNLSSSNKIQAARPLLVPNKDNEEVSLVHANLEYQEAKENIKPKNEPAVKQTITYKVRKGDTLSSLAKKFDVDARYLVKTNRLRSNKLKAGQMIQLTKVTTKAQSRTTSSAKHQQARSSKATRSHIKVKSRNKGIVRTKMSQRNVRKTVKSKHRSVRISSKFR